MIRKPSIANVRKQLDAQLPPDMTSLLKRAGSLATRQGVGVFIVGGFVRDLPLRRPTRDLDLVIEGDGIAMPTSLREKSVDISSCTIVFPRPS